MVSVSRQELLLFMRTTSCYRVVRSAVRASVVRVNSPILRDAIYLVDWTDFNETWGADIFTMWAAHCWKGFQGHRSKIKGTETFTDGGILIDGSPLKTISFYFSTNPSHLLYQWSYAERYERGWQRTHLRSALYINFCSCDLLLSYQSAADCLCALV